ncbi:MAG: SDR family NAD(P)-dependent oxidoreductase [Pikeienuella sp.]
MDVSDTTTATHPEAQPAAAVETRRTVLITGCSSGIGHHAAHALQARGWRVFATCRKEADCARLRSEGLESFLLDYQKTETIAAAVEEALRRSGGRLDALFNNGAFACPGALEDLPTDGLRELFEANFFGWHELTRRVIPTMRAQGHGRILQNSSVLGFTGLPMRGAYISSKFALEGYTDVLRLEMARAPIQVILIEPGPIKTQIRQNARPQYERWVKDLAPRSFWAETYRTVLEPRLYAENPRPDLGELSCEATTRKVIHALESRRPSTRYFVTSLTYAAALGKRFLPTRWLDRALCGSWNKI